MANMCFTRPTSALDHEHAGDIRFIRKNLRRMTVEYNRTAIASPVVT